MANAGGRHGMGAIPPAKWSKAKLVEAVEEQDGLIQKLREQAREDARSRPRPKQKNKRSCKKALWSGQKATLLRQLRRL